MSAEWFEWHAQARMFTQHLCLTAQAARQGLPDGLPPPLHMILRAVLERRAIGFQTQHNVPLMQTTTGGTSGTPKQITRKQSSWLRSFAANARHFDLQPGQASAVLGDLDHSLSLYALLEGLHLGLDVHLLTRLRPDRQMTQINEAGINMLYGTPSQLRQLVSSHSAAATPQMAHIICGGGMLDQTLRHDLQQQFPNAAIRVFYGAAETSFITMEISDTPLGSVGHAYEDVDIQIRNSVGQQVDGVGQVWVRSPYLADTVNGLPLPLQDGFVRVGELGRLDPQGALFLAGRSDRAVNIADQIVHPETTEVLIAPMGVCAVLPRLDAKRGQVLIAILAGPACDDRAGQVMSACRAALPPAARPRAVLFHPDFPQLPSGKPDLTGLAKWLLTQ